MPGQTGPVRNAFNGDAITDSGDEMIRLSHIRDAA